MTEIISDIVSADPLCPISPRGNGSPVQRQLQPSHASLRTIWWIAGAYFLSEEVHQLSPRRHVQFAAKPQPEEFRPPDFIF
jgi:hypothetical protein